MKKTFFDLPPNAVDPNDALFHILPIPYAKGDARAVLAKNAPNAVLDASALLSTIGPRSKRLATRFGVYTHDPVDVGEGNKQDLFAKIEKLVRDFELFSPRHCPIAIGGTNEISDAFITLVGRRFPESSAVRLGAKANLGRAFVERAPVLAGLRSFTPQEYQENPKLVDDAITCEQIQDDLDGVVEKLLWKCEQNVYLTIDVNFFDPSVIPGACYPEPGGLGWRRALELIEAIVLGKCVVGIDVVGLAPLGGGNIVSEYAAAKLIASLIDLVGQKKGVAP